MAAIPSGVAYKSLTISPKTPLLPPTYSHSGIWLATFMEAEQAHCGESILAKLTGLHPMALNMANKKRKGMTETYMITKLKKYGFQVVHLNAKMKLALLEKGESVKKDHLLLINAQLTPKDNSWLLCFDNTVFHNNEMTPVSFTSGIQVIIHNTWVIYHQRLEALRNNIRCSPSSPYSV